MIKICLICDTVMKVCHDKKPSIPNKEIIFTDIYECPKCGCKIYKSPNIIELAEAGIKEEILKRAKDAKG